LEQLNVAAKTRTSYSENFSIYIKPALGNLKVRDIHRLHIKQLLASAKKRNGDPLSKNSRRLIRATLSVLLAHVSLFGP
jgi:hypothetical protein